MPHVIVCLDKPGMLETRKATREAHLAHVARAEGAISQGGPFLDETGEMCGSLLIYESEDRGVVEAWCAEDPYAKAGLFASVEIRRWKRVIEV